MAHDSDDTQDVWDAVGDPTMGWSPLAFKVLREDQHVKTVRIEPDVTYIGRMPENHVVLDDGKVSRSHARVVRKGDDYFIEDQQSENGIYVDGKKIEKLKLKPGVKIGVGGHVLQVIEAQNDDLPATRESQLDKAEEEEWRMDATISGTPEQIAKMIKARQQKGPRLVKKEASAEAPKPVMSFKVQLGGKNFEKEFEFTQTRMRKETDGADDQMEVKITIGKWVLYKKVPL